MKYRILAIILIVVILISAVPVYGEPGEETEAPGTEWEEPEERFSGVLTGVDAELLEEMTDQPLDFFAQPTVEWSAAAESVTLSAERVLPFSPTRVFGGKYSLLIGTEAYSSYSGLTVSRSFGEAEGAPRLDASKAEYFVLSVCAPPRKGAEYRLSVRFVSYMISSSTSTQPITYEQTFSLEGGVWQTVLCDVTAFEGRGDIRSVSLTVTDGGAAYGDTVRAAVDSVGFTSCVQPVRALRFLTDSFLASGCEVSYEDGMTVSLTGTEATLKTPSPFTLTPAEDTVLCVKLRSSSGLRTLSLTVSPADPTLPSFSVSSDLSASSGISYCYFPLGTDPISSLTLTFSGSVRGEAEILSLTPLSYPVIGGGSGASVTSCLLAASGQSYEIEGTVSEEALRKYEGGVLLLYSLPLGEDADSFAAYPSTARAELTRQFRFTVPLEGEAQTPLTRKFLVVVSLKGSMIPLTGEFCLTNPEAVALASSVPEGFSGKKGACPPEAFSDTDRISDTVVEVPLETLFAPGSDGIPFSTDHTVYYFSEETLARLDRTQALCRLRGIRALFALTVTSQEGAAAAYSLLRQEEGAESTPARFAFNTAGNYGLAGLRAAVDLLASRYMAETDSAGGFVGFIVGENVNETAQNYWMGSTSLSPLVRAYAAALRTVYNSARAVNAAAKVYVSLSSRFGGTESRTAEESFGARVFLDALNEVISSQGNFPWQVAFDPYPDEAYLAYADTEAGTTPEAPLVTAANLDVLTSYISRRAFYYLGQYRPVLLYEPEKERELTDQNHLIRQAADYVYTCYKIGTKNYSLIESIVPSASHPIRYEDSLRLLDADPTGEGTSFALEVIGIRDWNGLITGFDRARTVSGSLLSSSPLGFRPSTVIGELTLFGFDGRGETAGFEALPEGASLLGGTTVGSVSYLSLTSPEGGSGDWFGTAQRFPSSLDLSVSPFLSFTLIPTALSGDAEEMECRIVLSSREHLVEVQTLVRAGEPNEILLDLRTFEGLKAVDSLRLYFRGRRGEDVGQPTVLIGEMRVLSEQYRSTDLRDAFDRAQSTSSVKPEDEARRADPRLILLLVTVLVVASTALALRLMNARRSEGGGKEKKREKKM